MRKEADKCRFEASPRRDTHQTIVHCATHDRPAPKDADSCLDIRPWLCDYCGRNRRQDEGNHPKAGTCLHWDRAQEEGEDA